jgi:hypothetical protein
VFGTADDARSSGEYSPARLSQSGRGRDEPVPNRVGRRNTGTDSAAESAASPTLTQPEVGTPPPPVTPLSVMVELVDNDDLRRQMKRRSRHRSKR